MKRLLLFAALALVATAAAAQTTSGTLVCESKNNVKHTCRADVSDGVVLVRQLSENPCVLGRTWGTTKNANGVWVDHGCRGEFIIGTGFTAPAGTAPATTARVVTCASVNNRQQRCAADTSLGVHLVRQASKNDCVLGRSWGFDERGIWVRRGCRGEFALGVAPAVAPMTSAAPRPLVVCESLNNRRNHCQADTRFGVALSRQLSDNECVAGRTWGFDSSGIWVTNGCRAEFVLTSTP